jgi:hypothetical protein
MEFLLIFLNILAIGDSRSGYHVHQISGVQWQSGTWKKLKEIPLLINFVLQEGRRNTIFFMYPTVTSARSCNNVGHLFWFTILAQHETNDVILYIHSVHKHRKYKCLGNTIDGNIFNKHNDQEKKTLVKRIFSTCIF